MLFSCLCVTGFISAMENKDTAWINEKIEACKNGDKTSCAFMNAYIDKYHASLCSERTVVFYNKNHDSLCLSLTDALMNKKFIENVLKQ